MDQQFVLRVNDGNIDGVDEFLAGNKNFIPADQSGFVLAVQNDDQDMVNRLLQEKFTDINSVNEDNETVLMRAENSPAVLQELLKHPHLKVNAVDGNKRTFLQRATMNNNDDVVFDLLARRDIDVNHGTPLYAAAKQNNIEIMKHLLSHPRIEPLNKEQVIDILETVDDPSVVAALLSNYKQRVPNPQALLELKNKKHVPFIIMDARYSDQQPKFQVILADSLHDAHQRHNDFKKKLLKQIVFMKKKQYDKEIVQDIFNHTLDDNHLNYIVWYPESNTIETRRQMLNDMTRKAYEKYISPTNVQTCSAAEINIDDLATTVENIQNEFDQI
jgi:hypothetical protein